MDYQPDKITEEEQSAIDAWLAKNQPTKIPQGKVYFDETEAIDWHAQRRASYDAKLRVAEMARKRDVALIRGLAAEGWSDKAIGEHMGRSHKYVFEARTAAGIKAGVFNRTPKEDLYELVSEEWQTTQELIAISEKTERWVQCHIKTLHEEGRVERTKYRTPIPTGGFTRGYKWRRKCS